MKSDTSYFKFITKINGYIKQIKDSLIPVSGLYRMRYFFRDNIHSPSDLNNAFEIKLLCFLKNVDSEEQDYIFTKIEQNNRDLASLELRLKNAQTRLNLLKFIKEDIRENTQININKFDKLELNKETLGDLLNWSSYKIILTLDHKELESYSILAGYSCFIDKLNVVINKF